MSNPHLMRLIKQADPEELEELLMDESLSEEQFEMVQAESNRRDMEEYFDQSLLGADGRDAEMSRKFNGSMLSFEQRWDMAESDGEGLGAE